MPEAVNLPAPNTPYFTPAQIPPSGTALNPQLDGAPIPPLFRPIKIRGVEFQNRVFVSPMCQYSADDGALTEWHKAHLGGIFTRGPGLTFVEATAVTANGRITPQDSGIWDDKHVKPLREIVEFAHSQGQKIGIQLAHAGRKASTIAPWLNGSVVSNEHGGWLDDVWGPSTVPFSPDYPVPKELSITDIKALVQAFVDATKRALKAGFDVIEIHNAHGYLLASFVSPISNKRTDEYGGSFENRIRLTLEVVDAIRAVIPSDMPLFLRISGTEWLEDLPEPSWRIEDTIKLAGILATHGVDLIDVSSGGNSTLQKIVFGPLAHQPYQAPLAEAVRKVHGVDTDSDTKILVSAVGSIRTGTLANEILEKGQADLVLVGRQFQKEPGSVWKFAEELNVQIKIAHQIEWGFKGRGKKAKSTQAK